jgi:hypothetical protein
MGLKLRLATNAINPSRGGEGYVTTYQAICANPLLHEHEFKRHRYILVLDEPHHVSDGGEWDKALRPLFSSAVFRVLMSGTMERGSRDRIAFLDYGDDGKPKLQGGANCVVYSRTQALEDKAIVPLEFTHVDGIAQWIDEIGQKRQEVLSSAIDERGAPYTVIRTEYATDLLRDAVTHWKNYRSRAGKGFSQLLIVAHSMDRAKELANETQQLSGLEVAVATSDDEKSSRQIARFCKGEVPILSTCQMAYEGMDAPAITHVVCLTHIRSKPWIEQMFARAVRTHPGKNKGWIYCPDDPLMNEVIAQIRSEQPLAVRDEADAAEANDRDKADKPGNELSNILPLTSEMTGKRLTELDGGAELTQGQVVWLQNQGVFQDFGDIARLVELTGGTIPELDEEKLARGELPPSEEEAILRTKIQQSCSRLDRQRGQDWGATNLEMLKTFNVQRKEMTLEQLRSAWAWIRQKLNRAA